MTKIIISSLLITFSFSSFGESLNLLCSGSDCQNRILKTLDEMECQAVPETLTCGPAASEPGSSVCSIQTQYCSEPKPSLFIAVDCHSGRKVSLRRYDRGLSLTWWMGFGPYVRTLCVE
ncbi:MAG: hypothetical protein AB7F86_11270 [Bdellovibrionales bacterium]